MSSIILFQSCRVYNRYPVSIDDAVKSEKRVKIKTTGNRTLKFTKLISEDGNYYGIKSNKNSGQYVKTLLIKEELQNIRLQNKALSIIYGIVVPLLVFFILIASWDGPQVLGGGSINAPM